jgi:hypothetical protein
VDAVVARKTKYAAKPTRGSLLLPLFRVAQVASELVMLWRLYIVIRHGKEYGHSTCLLPYFCVARAVRTGRRFLCQKFVLLTQYRYSISVSKMRVAARLWLIRRRPRPVGHCVAEMNHN